MLYVDVTREGDKVTAASILTQAEIDAMHTNRYGWRPRVENRNDWRTYEAAAEVAAALGPKYQATDAGPNVSPRYDVIDLPQVGQEVAYTFNGDYYPAGKIVSISKAPGCRKIVSKDDTGRTYTFWRRCRDGKPTGGAWIMDGVWSMIQGHHNRRNPEF
jgi:hypothetical protein